MHVAHDVQVSPILRQDSMSSIELVGQTATQAPQCPHFSMFTTTICLPLDDVSIYINKYKKCNIKNVCLLFNHAYFFNFAATIRSGQK